MTNADNQLLFKIHGCLFGAASGDAFGQPFRDLDWKRISAQFDSANDFYAWPQSVKDELKHSPATYGDLLRFTLNLANRAAREGVKPKATLLVDELFATTDLESLASQAALARIRAGIEPSRSAVPELAGSEAVYLAIPIGIANIGDPENAFISTRSIAGPLILGASLEAGQAMAAAVAHALMPGANPVTVFEAALEYSPPSVYKALQPAYIFAKEKLGSSLSVMVPAFQERFAPQAITDAHQPVVSALSAGLFFTAVCDGNAEMAVRTSASLGGWSHTAAAVAGSLCGALGGIIRFSSDWQQKVNSANPMISIARSAEGLELVIRKECERQSQKLAQIRMLAGES